MTNTTSRENESATLRRASTQIREVTRWRGLNTSTIVATADWLDDIAERHAPDPEPMELVLHYDAPCPTGECEDPGYHEGCVVCAGCFPSANGMDSHVLYPCAETKAALLVARAFLEAPTPVTAHHEPPCVDYPATQLPEIETVLQWHTWWHDKNACECGQRPPTPELNVRPTDWHASHLAEILNELNETTQGEGEATS